MFCHNVDKTFLEELLGRSHHYLAMNKQTTFWSRIDIAVMTNSICSICLGPILVVFYHYIMGDLSSDMYRQPVGLVYIFLFFINLYISLVHEDLFQLSLRYL